MSHCTLPISLVSGKFLGSSDRLLVAGNSPTSNVGIQYVLEVRLRGMIVSVHIYTYCNQSSSMIALCLLQNIDADYLHRLTVSIIFFLLTNYNNYHMRFSPDRFSKGYNDLSDFC
jgi:hypothetical protein